MSIIIHTLTVQYTKNNHILLKVLAKVAPVSLGIMIVIVAAVCHTSQKAIAQATVPYHYYYYPYYPYPYYPYPYDPYSYSSYPYPTTADVYPGEIYPYNVILDMVYPSPY
jgi:hypothetical protein